jgi:WD40 repeat protein
MADDEQDPYANMTEEQKEFVIMANEFDEKQNEHKFAKMENNLDTLDGEAACAEIKITNRTTHSKMLGSPMFGVAWCEGSNILGAAAKSSILVYDVRKGNMLWYYEMPNAADFLKCIEFSPDGKYIAFGGVDNQVTLRECEGSAAGWSKDKKVRTFEHHGGVFDIKFLDNNRFLSASGDGTICLWDMTATDAGCVKDCVQTFRVLQGTKNIGCSSLAIVDENRFIVGCGDAKCYMFDMRLAKDGNNGMVASFSGHFDENTTPNADGSERTGEDKAMGVTTVKMIPGSEAFGSAGEDGYVRIWDLKSHTQIGQIQLPAEAACTSMEFSASGRICFAGDEKGEIHCFDVLTGKSVAEPTKFHQPVAEGGVTCLTRSRDNFCIASTAANDNKAKNLAMWSL